jgi:flagellar basal body-associated protein FliL
MTSVTVEIPTDERPRRRLLAVVLIGLLLAGGVAGALALRGSSAPAPDEQGEIVVLEPLTTTLGEDAPHHARVGLGLVLTAGTDVEVVPARVALLHDALLRELAMMHADELRSAEGSAQLREALSAQARVIWGGEVVQRVVLTELMVQ